MKVVVAIDSFKGSLTSMEANKAAAEGVRAVYADAEICTATVSDGGEGYLDAFNAAIGGDIIDVDIYDPLMRPIKAQYLLKDRLAVIEIARACGLTLLRREELEPLKATTYGTGQLIADAVKRGAKHIIVGLGGSATSDAGEGMIRALTDTFSQDGTWRSIQRLRQVRFTIASDVANPLCGPDGAAHVFGPQKGATPEMVDILEERAQQFSIRSAKLLGYDRSKAAGAGAAGGLGYALMQYLNAECKSGVDLLLDTMGYDDMAREADYIITGEGSADFQTLMGKLPMGILHRSGNANVCLIAGQISERAELLRAGFARVECINPPDIIHSEAMRPEIAYSNIRRTVCKIMGGQAR